MVEAGVAALVVLVAVGVATALVVRSVPVPYVVALALVGAVTGTFFRGQPIHLTHEVILLVLLPGLLFEAAFNLRWGHLRANLAAVVLLSTAGVFLTTALAGLLVSSTLGLGLSAAVVFGAIVAPTDPVAVVAVFRRLGVPARLTNLVEAESLLNDGTGVVVFGIALGLLASGGAALGPADAAGAAWQFVRLSAGGVALGAAAGLLLSLVTRRIDDPQVEISVTVVAAYGSYVLAELAGVSGILAVVGSGLVMGNYGRPRAMSRSTQVAVTSFWEAIAFLLNSVVFLLIGTDVPLSGVLEHWGLVLAGFGIVTLARAVAVHGLFFLLHPVGRAVNLRWQLLISWSGLRGAVAVALLLSLPDDPPELRVVKPIAYGVVLLSIVVQGGSIAWMARWLLPHSHPQAREDATG